MNNNVTIKNNKGLAVLGLAIVCIAWMYFTGGASGIGWFILGLLLIFG